MSMLTFREKILIMYCLMYFLYTFSACPTFKITWLYKTKIANPSLSSTPVSDRAECLTRCLNIDCTMFAYERQDGDDDCWLYTVAFSQAEKGSDSDITLYILECTSTGTYQHIYLICGL